MNLRRIIGLIVIGVLTTSIVGTIIMGWIWWDGQKYVVDCPPYNREYAQWFPYADGDQIEFSFQERERTMTVRDYRLNHRNQYDSRYKCGCCEEGVSFSIEDSDEIVRIDFQNYHNELSCFGFDFELGGKHTQSSDIVRDSIINNVQKTIIKWDGLIAVSGKGIVVFKDSEGRVWVQKRILKSGQVEELDIEECNDEE